MVVTHARARVYTYPHTHNNIKSKFVFSEENRVFFCRTHATTVETGKMNGCVRAATTRELEFCFFFFTIWLFFFEAVAAIECLKNCSGSLFMVLQCRENSGPKNVYNISILGTTSKKKRFSLDHFKTTCVHCFASKYLWKLHERDRIAIGENSVS